MLKKLGFGLMRLPVIDEKPGQIDLAAMTEMIDAFIAGGGTYFDTAYVYHSGTSESGLRETVVKRYPRNVFTITDKLPVFNLKTTAEMEAAFAEQLARCGVDYFDYYWLHALSQEHLPTADRIGAWDFVQRLKNEGKVRHIGFSFHDTPDVLESILKAHPEAEIVQLQINYLDWDDPAYRARECYEMAIKYGKKVVIMEPIKGGTLAKLPPDKLSSFEALRPGLSEPAWALRFAASLPEVFMVLSGMSTLEQVEQNVRSMSAPDDWTAADTETALRVGAEIRRDIAVPCTACAYCVDGCPVRIPIPQFFAIYNRFMLFGEEKRAESETAYEKAAAEGGKASECVKCGACESVCPQHIKIRDQLELIANEFER